MSDQVQKNNLPTERRVIHSFGFWFAICILLIAADQVTKYFVQRGNAEIFLNENFAFGVPLPTVVMYVVYALVLAIVVRIVYVHRKQLTAPAKLGWTLILAGGLSNIFERIILGHVRDFIYVANGVFNTADCFIIAGLLAVALTYPKKTL